MLMALCNSCAQDLMQWQFMTAGHTAEPGDRMSPSIASESLGDSWKLFLSRVSTVVNLN